MIGYRKMIFLSVLTVAALGAGATDLLSQEGLAGLLGAIALAFGAGNASEHLGVTVARLVAAAKERKAAKAGTP